MSSYRVHFNLRPHQLAAYEAETRFECRVWHRRAGKTFHTMGRMLARALQTGRSDWQGFYLAPTRVQAKNIAWSYLTRWVRPLGVQPNESELKVVLPNGAKIQLLGGEQYDSLRGLYMDDVTLDEAALIPSAAWTQVISPALADRKGRATFMGTPMGRMNLLFDMWEECGLGEDPEFSRSLLTYQDTNILDPKEIARMRRTMIEAEFNQELLCSWDAAMPGSYWGRAMAKADAEGRVTSVKYDHQLPVYVALDLGISQGAMPCVYFQLAGTEIRIIDHETFEGTSIPDLVKHWQKKPYPIATVLLPHDRKVRELGTGKTREETFRSLGCTVRAVPDVGLDEGISQVERAIPNMWFDRDNTKMLREAMVAFRSEYDEVKRVHRLTPVHDWARHIADAVRYMVVGRPGTSFQKQNRNTRASSRDHSRYGGLVA
ncbi:terminase large subunit domain-containing protein [Qingshengfaniella alkalisoli]|uniref:Uncharacterized protein n=1 Tax=Qingshengfaniella alkalisoli TaxID=2599296 RepID=A0A5B8J712_9RHOB|nr:terminase family protein [Qingshengfaniella alkalisoli]QDY70120.1 hypothetical protein FPZ52_11140 [Qingshengfaniella alkalisoli]